MVYTTLSLLKMVGKRYILRQYKIKIIKSNSNGFSFHKFEANLCIYIIPFLEYVHITRSIPPDDDTLITTFNSFRGMTPRPAGPRCCCWTSCITSFCDFVYIALHHHHLVLYSDTVVLHRRDSLAQVPYTFIEKYKSRCWDPLLVVVVVVVGISPNSTNNNKKGCCWFNVSSSLYILNLAAAVSVSTSFKSISHGNSEYQTSRRCRATDHIIQIDDDTLYILDRISERNICRLCRA